MTTITNLELPRHLEGSDVTWTKLKKSSGATSWAAVSTVATDMQKWKPSCV